MRGSSTLFLSALLCFAACTPLENPMPDGGDVPDAGEPLDAGSDPDAGTEVDAGARDVDWRTVRGTPWQTRVVGEYPGARPFAMTDGGFVLVSACDAGACEYEFRDTEGAVKQRRTNLRSLFSTSVSATGGFASLFEATPSDCVRADGSTTELWSGSWHLVDLDTGASSASLTSFVTAAFIDPAFLRSGVHARLPEWDPARCEQVATRLRPTAPPFTAPPAEARLGPSAYVHDELADGSLVVSDMPAWKDVITFVDVRGASFERLVNDDATLLAPAGDVLHTLTRQPARSLSSFDFVERRAVRTELPWMERDHLFTTASDRYIVLCTPARPNARCEVLDGLGVRAPVVITAQARQRLLPIAVAGKAHFVVSAHDDQLWRRSLITGEEVLVHPRVAEVSSVGGGRAVLVRDGDTVIAVESDRSFTFPGAFRGVVDAVALGASHDAPQSGTLLVVTASATGGENWLHAWNTATGRVVRLTDSLFFNEPFGAPITSADWCNAPGYVRSAGEPSESAFVHAKLLHFTEFVPEAQPRMRLFVMPLDLSAPPRLIAEGPSGFCGTPLATPGGDRLWLPVPMPTGGVRGVMATP